MLLYTCGLTHTHTHTVCTPQAECHAVWLLTDRCSKKTPSPDSGLAPGLSELHPRALTLGDCLCPLVIRPACVTCCRNQRRGGETSWSCCDSHWSATSTVGLVMAAFNPLMQGWPLQTRRGSAAQWKVSRRRQECGSGAADTVVLFSFFSSVLPVQGQTGCVRHSPSGSVFVCTLEGCHPPSASHLRARRRNLNLADRRRARTARSSFFFLSFSLCAATYTHISL